MTVAERSRSRLDRQQRQWLVEAAMILAPFAFVSAWVADGLGLFTGLFILVAYRFTIWPRRPSYGEETFVAMLTRRFRQMRQQEKAVLGTMSLLTLGVLAEQTNGFEAAIGVVGVFTGCVLAGYALWRVGP